MSQMSLLSLLILSYLSFIISFEYPDSFYPKQSYPKYPNSSYPLCEYSQVLSIMSYVYNAGQTFNEFNNIGIYCNMVNVVNDDGIMLCNDNGTSSLPFGADLILAFSGTKNPGDMFSDMEAGAIFNDEVGIQMNTYYGFNKKFYEWKPTIDEWFPSVNSTVGTIVITGHSLGASVAHITALYLQGKGFSVEVITAGEPASFKPPHTQADLDLKHTRFVNHYSQIGCWNSHIVDIIPNLANGFGYTHTNTSLEIPLHRIDDCDKSITSYSTEQNGTYYDDPYIHQHKYYLIFAENIYCTNLAGVIDAFSNDDSDN